MCGLKFPFSSKKINCKAIRFERLLHGSPTWCSWASSGPQRSSRSLTGCSKNSVDMISVFAQINIINYIHNNVSKSELREFFITVVCIKLVPFAFPKCVSILYQKCVSNWQPFSSQRVTLSFTNIGEPQSCQFFIKIWKSNTQLISKTLLKVWHSNAALGCLHYMHMVYNKHYTLFYF